MCFCHCHIAAKSKIKFLICTGCHLFAIFVIILLSLKIKFSPDEIEVVVTFLIFHFLASINCILILVILIKCNPKYFFKKTFSFFIFYFYAVFNTTFLVLCIYLCVCLSTTFVIIALLFPSIICFIVVLINIFCFIYLFKKRDEISNLCNDCRIHCNYFISSHTLSFPDNPPSYELFKPPSYDKINCL